MAPNNITPLWSKIKSEQPDVHALLTHLAAAIYEQGTESIFLPVEEQSALLHAVEHQIIKREGDTVTFAVSDLRLQYVAHHVTDLALTRWDQPQEFCKWIDKVNSLVYRLSLGRELVPEVLFLLSEEHHKDLLGRVELYAQWSLDPTEETTGLSNIFYNFCNVLPSLTVDFSRLARTLTHLYQGPQHNLTGGWIFQAIFRLAARSEADALGLLAALGADVDSPIVDFHANILVGLSHFNLPTAHAHAIEYTQSPSARQQIAGIDALGNFDYSSTPSLLTVTEHRLAELLATDSAERMAALANAYGILAQQDDRFGEPLATLAHHTDLIVKTRVAHRLHELRTKALHTNWYLRALLGLTGVRADHQELGVAVDLSIAGYIGRDSQTLLRLLEAVVTNRQYGSEEDEAELPQLLSATFEQLIVTQPYLLDLIVTTWFASHDPGLHHAAADIVKHCFDRLIERHNHALCLDLAVLDRLNEQEIINILKRFMGYVVDGPALAAAFSSVLQRETWSDEFIEFVIVMLSDHVLYNFPGTAGEFLHQIVDREDTPAYQRNVLQDAMERSKVYHTALRELPRLKEFSPPSDHVYALRRAERGWGAKMMEDVQRQSVLLSLIQRVPLKYGRASFRKEGAAYSQPNSLGSIAHTVEIPRGELIDPLGQTYLRFVSRHAGLLQANDGQVQNQDEGPSA